MARQDYDLIVIGAGSGGVRAARIAAGHGARVLVAEEHRPGGTCVIRGCVPKKLFVYASRFVDEFEDAAGFGWSVDASFDWPTLVANKDVQIGRLEAIYVQNLEKAGATLARSRAVLEDAHTVRLTATGETVSAKTVLIATGGRPFVDPTIEGAELAVTSNELFYLPRLPERMLVVGAGYIAVEFASLFNLLGVEVTILQRGVGILRGFEDELRAGLRDAMAARGVRFLFGEMPAKIERAAGGLRVTTLSGRTLDADCVMMATGRVPNTADLGLERAGVAVDKVGAVVVDEFSKTTAKDVYAVGDVTNRLNLTPNAIREGHAFADSVFGGTPRVVDRGYVPTAVFSTPELGTVGMTELEARLAYRSVDLYHANFRTMRNVMAGREERVLMKIVVDGDTDRVLGVHILGEAAAEMAQTLAIAVKMGARKADFDAVMALHPTVSEELVTIKTKSASHVREAAE